MFNLWPKKKSVDEILEDANLQPLNFTWTSIPDDNSKKDAVIKNLREQQEFLYKENEELKKILENIEEDGTYEHNNAIKLREENVELKLQLDDVKTINYNLFKAVDVHKAEKEKLELRLVAYQKMTEGASSSIAELTKEVRGLRHLKEENVQLMERVNEIDSDMNKEYQAEIFTLKNDIAMWKAKNQIIDNNYKKCTEQRDEYKHQLIAANKEIEKLKEDIVDYVIEKDDEIKGLKKTQDWNKLNRNGVEKRTEKYYVCNHCGYKVAHDTNYWGGCGFCKDGLMIEKEEEQKHPMYPIHWGTLDPYIHEQAKEQSIEEVVESLKGMKTQGFEDYDSRDFEQPVKVEQNIEEIVKDTLNKVTNSENYKNKVKEEKQKQIEFNSEELLKRVTEFADSITGTKAFPKDLFDKAKGLIEGVKVDLEAPLTDLPKTFLNEFQQETTTENLEEKFDNEKDILDYFNKIKVTTESIGDKEEWKCPCNICKESKVSWEEAASDLALKVAKLERQIEELKTIKITSDPNYQHFLKHGKWPWHWNKENKLDSSREYDDL
jgi:molecular chaperone GrpE (heat shock protein)/predicted  nucleic acid-binding Zn-ribbon protein